MGVTAKGEKRAFYEELKTLKAVYYDGEKLVEALKKMLNIAVFEFFNKVRKKKGKPLLL